MADHPAQLAARRLMQVMVAALACLAFSPLKAAERRAAFIGLEDFSNFARQSSPERTTLLSPRLEPGLDWQELIASWNIDFSGHSNAWLEVEARGHFPDHTTRFYHLGRWAASGASVPSGSVNGQRDADGVVKTDTLRLNRPGAAVELRLTLHPDLPLKFLGLSFSTTNAPAPASRTNLAAWGKSIAAPERSQMSFPEGREWCSPTSTSMVMAYWASLLQRPEMDLGVEAVARAVFDRNWPGTGNWPFNTAHAGGFPGMRAYVTRLNDVAEMEDWIAAGFPVVASVTYSTLKGSQREPSGHLIVCAGFTAEGDLIANDPGTSQNVRKTFPRANFINAWRSSGNTVYLIYPEGAPIPRSPNRTWEQRESR